MSVVGAAIILGLIVVKGVQALEASLFTERARANLTNDQYEQYKAWRQGQADYPTSELGRPVRRGGLGHAMLGSVVMVAGAVVLLMVSSLGTLPGASPRAVPQQYHEGEGAQN